MTEQELRQLFDAWCGIGPLTTVARAVAKVAYSRLPEGLAEAVVIPSHQGALADYLRECIPAQEPLFAIPPADQVFPPYLDRRDLNTEERRALFWACRVLASLHAGVERFLGRFGAEERDNLQQCTSSWAIEFQEGGWENFCRAARHGMILHPYLDGIMPQDQWVYPAGAAFALAEHLLCHAGRYGRALILVPWDRRTLPILNEADAAVDKEGDQLERAITAALMPQKEQNDLELIRHIRESVALGKNRAETAEAYLKVREWPAEALGGVEKQITRLMPRIRRDIPGFQWPKKKRPNRH